MINWLERRIQRIAIPNITVYIIVGQVIAYVAAEADPNVTLGLQLIPEKVLAGEYYRLLSFVVMPPGAMVVWAFFFWYLFYFMGTALEYYWGTARYNLFLLIGYVATVSAAFLVPTHPVDNEFVQGSVFLAFAFLNPTFTLHLMFIFPVQIKWLARLTWLIFGVTFSFGSWGTRVAITASVLNFLLFFWKDIFTKASYGQRHMRRQFGRLTEKKPEYIHKCVTCGMTDNDDRNMDFRYCSKCSGDLCYCSDHLKNHEHVSEPTDESSGEVS